MKKIRIILLLCCFVLGLFLATGCSVNNRSAKLGEGTISIPSYTIKAPSSGKLLGLIAEKQERISKGQPLFAIEDKTLDKQLEKLTTELAKAQAELKALEQGTPTSIGTPDVATAQKNFQKAQAQAAKMNQLLAMGAVSRKQAQAAQMELQSAMAALQAASNPGQTLKQATPEAIEAHKQKVAALQQQRNTLLDKQQKHEALSPCTAIITNKFLQNGQLAREGQEVLTLLSQDTAVINCRLKAKQELPQVGTPVYISVKDSPVTFSGKITAAQNGSFTVTSTEKPENIKAETSVTIELKAQ